MRLTRMATAGSRCYAIAVCSGISICHVTTMQHAQAMKLKAVKYKSVGFRPRRCPGFDQYSLSAVEC